MLLRAGDGQDGPAGRIVKEGDLVVVYERFDSMKSCRVTAKGQFSNKWGDFAVKVGCTPGSGGGVVLERAALHQVPRAFPCRQGFLARCRSAIPGHPSYHTHARTGLASRTVPG